MQEAVRDGGEVKGAVRLVHKPPPGGQDEMLFTIAVILLILWLLGFATHVVGSVIHVVLVIALVLFVLGLFTGRRTTI